MKKYNIIKFVNYYIYRNISGDNELWELSDIKKYNMLIMKFENWCGDNEVWELPDMKKLNIMIMTISKI